MFITALATSFNRALEATYRHPSGRDYLFIRKAGSLTKASSSHEYDTKFSLLFLEVSHGTRTQNDATGEHASPLILVHCCLTRLLLCSSHLRKRLLHDSSCCGFSSKEKECVTRAIRIGLVCCTVWEANQSPHPLEHNILAPCISVT